MKPRPSSWRPFAVAAVLTGLIGATSGAAAQSLDLAGEAALSSDLMDRGVLASSHGPVAAGSLFLVSPAGWSFGIGLGLPVERPRDGQAQLSVARGWSLDGDWQSRASLAYYAYPAEASLRAFERVEAGWDLGYRDLVVVGVTAMGLRMAQGWRLRAAADLNTRWPLGEHTSLLAGIGSSVLPIADGHTRYTYGNLGLGWHRDAWRGELSLMATDRHVRQADGEADRSRWVATLSRSF